MKSLCSDYIPKILGSTKKGKILTHYRFLTTNSASSKVVKMRSLCSDYIKVMR